MPHLSYHIWSVCKHGATLASALWPIPVGGEGGLQHWHCSGDASDTAATADISNNSYHFIELVATRIIFKKWIITHSSLSMLILLNFFYTLVSQKPLLGCWTQIFCTLNQLKNIFFINVFLGLKRSCPHDTVGIESVDKSVIFFIWNFLLLYIATPTSTTTTTL